MTDNQSGEEKILARTKHMELVDQDGWSFVRRIGNTGIVGIIAATDEGCLLLVEQFRPPVGRTVIELPAGLAGDIADEEDESLQRAAERELLEETGYVARQWTQVVTVASSAGLTDEAVTLFLAEGLTKKGPGGGDASEDIHIHEIPLAEAPGWLAEVAASGTLIDSRVYAALFFLLQGQNSRKSPSIIRYVTGDATVPQGEGAKVIVHVCNDIGGWGAGFVLALSARWEKPEREYRLWFDRQADPPFILGEVQFVEAESSLWVANLIGQHGIRRVGGRPPVRYEAIRHGLRRVAEFAMDNNATIHMPRIGSGLAGGKWSEIEKIIDEEICSHGIKVTVYDLP